MPDGDVAEDLSREVNTAKITEGTMLDPFRSDLLRGKTTVITGGGTPASVAPSRSDDEVAIDGGEALLSGQEFAGLAQGARSVRGISSNV